MAASAYTLVNDGVYKAQWNDNKYSDIVDTYVDTDEQKEINQEPAYSVNFKSSDYSPDFKVSSVANVAFPGFVPTIEAKKHFEQLDSLVPLFSLEKFVTFLVILSIPLWPADAIFYSFAFSVLVLSIEEVFINEKTGLFAVPLQFVKTAATAVLIFWIVGILEIFYGQYVQSSYDLSVGRIAIFLWFLAKTLDVLLLKWLPLLINNFSKGKFVPYLQKRVSELKKRTK